MGGTPRSRLRVALLPADPFQTSKVQLLEGVFKYDRFQSFFAVGALDTFSATPTGNGVSPILKTVPDCSMS
jgi:hypothetical protein